MRVEQARWTGARGWEPAPPGRLGEAADLVLLFSSTALLSDPSRLEELQRCYPRARLAGCSTAGEIFGAEVTDDSVVATAVEFEATRVDGGCTYIDDAVDSYAAGVELARCIRHENLAHVFVLSDGKRVNGTELVRGLTDHLPEHLSVTGGLSGDGTRFERTLVVWGATAEEGRIAIVGLYGHRLTVGYASLGGWDPFGPERLVTRSSRNVVYEFDDQSALALYKKYLGEHAAGLPATGLLFPLCVRTRSGGTGVVRTILSVNEAEQSLTFAGTVPEGAYARLMKANFERLIDGAIGAARTSSQPFGSASPELAILISCVGRKMILKQRIEDEVEGVRDVLGASTQLTGFYSYGEISPFTPNARCELHNQTMTITTLSETCTRS